MQTRRLGNSGLAVSPLCFGGNVFGWTADLAQSFKLLDAFAEAGGNFIDTADVYSRWAPGNQGGESETIIGRWLRRNARTRGRDRLIIATKVGMDMGAGRKGLSAARIRRAVEDSLRRLRTDYIDLYQSHADDPDTPMEETLSAYGALIAQGKVRYIGASNFSAARLREALAASRAHGLPAYVSLQPEYNLYRREGYERELEPLCRDWNIGVIGYYALASGFLTGKYRAAADSAKGARGARMAAYLNERGLGILAALDAVAARHRANPARVALAWLIARPGVTAPIASATSLDQLHDLVEATRLRLDAEDIARLDRASAWR
ncbi:MAG: aldo/keto reductase [Burkholderiales bacterium]|nr:aldo/keto reductase [Burkholderiales bacterium]